MKQTWHEELCSLYQETFLGDLFSSCVYYNLYIWNLPLNWYFGRKYISVSAFVHQCWKTMISRILKGTGSKHLKQNGDLFRSGLEITHRINQRKIEPKKQLKQNLSTWKLDFYLYSHCFLKCSVTSATNQIFMKLKSPKMFP